MKHPERTSNPDFKVYRPNPACSQSVSGDEIKRAAEAIRHGEVVAFPTETVYGLGAAADHPEAIARIFQMKGRPQDNPLIVHISDPDQLTDFADPLPVAAQELVDRLWPGPLTIVLKRLPHVLDSITAGLDTVALRLPAHPVARALIEQTGPLVAPSANRSGRPSPTTADHVREDFGESLLLLDGGACDIGLESTVLDLHRDPWMLLRPGYYAREDLERLSGQTILDSTNDTVDASRPRSPGMKYTHYKPNARVDWYQTGDELVNPEETLYLFHSLEIEGLPHSFHLDGDMDALAHRLYDLFRVADQRGVSTILIEPLPTTLCHPMLPALRNRIEKAIGLEL